MIWGHPQLLRHHPMGTVVNLGDAAPKAGTVQFIDLSFVANVTHEVEGIAFFILGNTWRKRCRYGHGKNR